MLVRRCTLLLILFALSIQGARAAAPLPGFTANYTIHSLNMKGITIGTYGTELSRDSKGRYLYQAHTRTAGVLAWVYKDQIDERSQWLMRDAGIRPLRYSYQRTGGSKERLVELNFDWQRGIVENTVGGDSWRMNIPPGALDKLVVQLAMMLDLQHGKNVMEYAIADGGKLKTYRFKIVGKEQLTTPAGVFDTVKLERVREHNTRATFLWCAPKLHYLPVRIDQREEDDSKFSMVLTQHSGK